jgi:hypothetical protein
MSAQAPPNGSPRVPDFFVVGHPKSGTTALWDMLKSHPQIYTPANKEPYFFAEELHPPAATPRTFGHTPATLAEYLALFADAAPQQRAGEASAPYLWSRSAARRIAEVQPAARIIAILREPASFLHSLHLQFVQIYIEPEKDMRKAIALEQVRRQGKDLPSDAIWGPEGTFYSDYVRYVEQLQRYTTTTGATTTPPCARFSASSRSTTRNRSASKKPTPRCVCARSACTRSCTRSQPERAPSRAPCRAPPERSRRAGSAANRLSRSETAFSSPARNSPTRA